MSRILILTNDTTAANPLATQTPCVIAYSRRVEAAQQTERVRLEAALDAISDAVICTDARGSINYLNPAAQRLTGWSLEDASGRGVSEVFRLLNAATHKLTRTRFKVCNDALTPAS